MKKYTPKTQNTQGFSIAELLVGMAISGVLLTTIFSAYYSQQKSYTVQDQVASMVQNLRAGMDIIIREIRMAGYDPTGNANAGIITANATSINLSEDIDGDASISGDENITYALANNGNGDNNLERNGNLAAENIDAVDFVYLNASGASTATLSEIRSVQITLVARTGRGDLGYVDTEVFTNQQNTPIFGPANDNFRRKRLTAEVRCRNLGL